jgi:NAD(P)-dependent dehydrogenase (short-subunit alcohol dehydrogenase family)
MGVLQGKVAIVSGGGSVRWRREVCQAFSRAGACVAVIDAESVTAVGLAECFDPTGAQVISVHCDAAIGEAFSAAVDWFGSVGARRR